MIENVWLVTPKEKPDHCWPGSKFELYGDGLSRLRQPRTAFFPTAQRDTNTAKAE